MILPEPGLKAGKEDCAMGLNAWGRRMSRRTFLSTGALMGACMIRAPAILERTRIARIRVQEARGRRRTPVAPNAYAPYRGYDTSEMVVRIALESGEEGVGRLTGKPESCVEDLRSLLGVDPHGLFEWDGSRVRGFAKAHREPLSRLGSVDVALLDVLGKLERRAVADLLGARCRDGVTVYDSSLYMEDLLGSAEREGLAYLDGPPPEDPEEMVARKAVWVLRGEAGVRTLKIKIGRVKWMGDPERALDRDIAVVRAVRRSVGSDVRLFVDGNNGYLPRPLDALRFAEAVANAKVYAMEEMFPEEKPGRHRQVKEGMRKAGIPTKLADGEGHRDGIPEELMKERVKLDGHDEPLFDINQPDMNANGILRMRELAAASRRFGLALAPHNFASKMGFYPQVHLGLVTPGWEFSEVDDSEFPGIQAPGIEIREGKASLTATAGLGVSVDEGHLDSPTLDLRC